MTIDIDHGTIATMTTVSVSQFKARCLALLAEVERTGRPLTVTKRGKPLARVLPPTTRKPGAWLGCMAGTARILGDLTEPLWTEEDQARADREWDELTQP
jgi:prevent-host-death family protein